MAAAVVTVLRTTASANRLVMLLSSDGGEVAATTIPNATLVSRTLGSGNTPGPLLKTFQATYASQAAARAVLTGGPVSMVIQARGLGGLVTLTSTLWGVDVNVAATLPTIEVAPPDDVAAAGRDALLYVQYHHTSVR